MRPMKSFHWLARRIRVDLASPAAFDAAAKLTDLAGEARGLVLAELDLDRRRLARGQTADHRTAHTRGLARLLGVRRGARLRGRHARHGQARGPGEPLGRVDGPQGDDGAGGDPRAHPRGREEIRQRRSDLRQADVLGRGRWAFDDPVRPGLYALRALPVRGADAGTGRLLGDEVALPAPDARVDADRHQG